jgi:hypothetical protein
MIRRGFEDSAYQFYNQYQSFFKSNNNELNRELNLLESVRSISDIKSSLEFDKYLKNKI